MVDNQRDMRLLDGRRVQLKDLLDRGLLTAGDVLEFRRPRPGERYSAKVTQRDDFDLRTGESCSTVSSSDGGR
jgi:hypothetical protein